MKADNELNGHTADTAGHGEMKIERLVPIVSGIGLLGMIVSLFSLSDYFGPLLRILQDFLHSIQ